MRTRRIDHLGMSSATKSGLMLLAAVVIALVVGLLGFGGAQPAEAQLATGQRVLGAYTHLDGLNSFNQTVGQPAHISSHFQDWAGTDKAFDRAKMDRAINSGARPMMTWMSQDIAQGATQPYYTNKNIYLHKKFDPYITEWAKDARDWGNSCAEAHGFTSPCKMFLRFNHEMNGFWYPWSAGVNGNTASDYVLAWRHVHGIFEEVGADNVKWVWAGSTCIHSCSSLSALYPGDAYVDWTALDGYNRWPRSWRTGSQIFGAHYDQVTGQIAPAKPFMIAEVGSGEDPNDPYRKAKWLSQFFNSDIPNRLPKTRAVVYFSADLRSTDRPNYAVDSSPQSLAAYKKVAAQWRWGGTLVDIKPPTAKILDATDRATTTEVPLRKTSFKATFSEKMLTTSLNKSTYKLYRCPTATSTDCTTQITDVTVGAWGNGYGATLNPYGAKTTVLSANTRYKVVVSTGARDLAGNTLDQNPLVAGNNQKVRYIKTGSS